MAIVVVTFTRPSRATVVRVPPLQSRQPRIAEAEVAALEAEIDRATAQAALALLEVDAHGFDEVSLRHGALRLRFLKSYSSFCI